MVIQNHLSCTKWYALCMWYALPKNLMVWLEHVAGACIVWCRAVVKRTTVGLYCAGLLVQYKLTELYNLQVACLQLQVSAIMPPKSKSAPWNSFDLVDGEKDTQYKLCQAKLAYNASTTAMQNHLRAKHGLALGATTTTSVSGGQLRISGTHYSQTTMTKYQKRPMGKSSGISWPARL